MQIENTRSRLKRAQSTAVVTAMIPVYTNARTVACGLLCLPEVASGAIKVFDEQRVLRQCGIDHHHGFGDQGSATASASASSAIWFRQARSNWNSITPGLSPTKFVYQKLL